MFLRDLSRQIQIKLSINHVEPRSLFSLTELTKSYSFNQIFATFHFKHGFMDATRRQNSKAIPSISGLLG